jgi:hypothetical protein
MRAVGGELDVQSAPGHTRVCAHVPAAFLAGQDGGEDPLAEP